MMKSRARILTLIASLLLFPGFAADGEEGMWLLDAVDRLPFDRYRGRGLELTPSAIYDTSGPGLKDAVVQLGGGTGSFISATGLILTNHHVAYRAIQAVSSLENDYLRDGFLARNRSEEIPTQTTAELVVGMKEITAAVLSAIPDSLAGEARTAAVQSRLRALEAEAGRTAGLTCRASELYSGARYYLFTILTLRDIRLVYAPPSSIGNFGGETDNWMWPRHTGDFTILRAYVGPDGNPAARADSNIPYRPKVFLPISRQGAREGEFAMVLGFPGTTYRYRDASSVALACEETLPFTIDLYTARINAAETITATDRNAEIQYASKIRGLANTSKKYRGVLEGFRRSGYPALKRKEDDAFAAWIIADPGRAERYGNVLAEMERLSSGARTVNRKNLWFTSINSAVEALAIARRFATFAETREDSSLASSRERLRTYLVSMFKNYDSRIDRAMLAAMILASSALPAGQNVATFAPLTDGMAGVEERVHAYVADLFDETLTASPEGCEELLAMEPDEILDDPMVRLAARLAAEQEPVTLAYREYTTGMAGLQRRYVQARLEEKNGALTYPDANRTLRLSYGQVRGYRPRDAVGYSAFTTLGGVMEKEKGERPFVVPAKLRELWEKKDFGEWADPVLHDVPVAFLATLDITGGNSGSPVINGRGELIGCAFDGNWESVASDYKFLEEYNRSINVDARYVLFLLEKYAGADFLLGELTIR